MMGVDERLHTNVDEARSGSVNIAVFTANSANDDSNRFALRVGDVSTAQTKI